MDNELNSFRFVAVGLMVAAILCAVALVIVAWSHCDVLLSDLLVLLFQFLMGVAAVAVSLAFLGFLWFTLTRFRASTLERLADIEHRFSAEIAALRRQTSPMIAGLLLFGQAMIGVTDKAIQGSPITKIGVFVALTVWFWIANLLATQSGSKRQWLGIAVWFLGVAAIPWVLAAYYSLGVPDLWAFIMELDTLEKVYFASMLLVLLLLPWGFRKLDSSK